ncbi:hypothetical protein TNCV_1726441 [Trichonephila clavipes]|nr:hypothetical protein TNCV_1726441 [Trichonephila clavipes]
MPNFKITHQVDNANFTCVVRAELATMCFVSENVADMVALINYCKLSQETISQRLPELESLREKKSVVSYEDRITESTKVNIESFVNLQ